MITTEQEKLYHSSITKTSQRIAAAVLARQVPLQARMRHCPQPVPFAQRLQGGEYVPVREGDTWGKEWDSAWFHLTGEVPSDWAGREVVARLDFNGEALVFDERGAPVQGLSNGSVFDENFARDLLPLLRPARGGERVELWVEAAANSLFGINREQDPLRDCPRRHGSYEGKVNSARLCCFDRELWNLWIDFDLLLNLHASLPERSVRRRRILEGLAAAAARYAENPAHAAACRELLAPLLAQPAHASAVTNTAVGHAHIDTGWLWPVRETIRKSARTFSTQLALIDEYPGYVFGASQPQHYAMVKEHYPELYARIKRAVAAGRWECQGAMWVEADCNIISGESMVRQVLHGKNFFRDEFGVDVDNIWIPDVFGYSASMPQIMRRAGVKYFLTQKISWSQFNGFPYTTFRWRGIDGSELITHFPPEDTYNSMLKPSSLRKAEEHFRESGVLDEMMCLFGVGDGGGGPTRRNLEFGRRAHNLEGVPRVSFGRADEFFARLQPHREKLPVWVGELYLELHRGTLTTQARTKRGNRKLELALRATEFLLTLAPLADYPVADMDRLWKTLLINQFHDILPGSSIHMVYEKTEQQYGEAMAECERLQRAAASKALQAESDCLTAVNTLGHAVREAVEVTDILEPGETLVDEQGAELPVQHEADGTRVALLELPALAISTLRKRKGAPATAAAVGELVLENARVRYVFADNGELVEALDKESGLQVLAPGARGNVLTLYADHPHNWDAWDIDICYERQALQTATGESWESLGAGPARRGLRLCLRVGESFIEQRVFLAAGSRRLDFRTRVTWRERHRMLRVSFPVNVRSERAAFEIQYGHVYRSTHRNTTWDMAKFEVAAQRWVDLADSDHGVALLNDCKYGHKVHENVLDLCLLRATTNPDPDADLGTHEFTYSLLPHVGVLSESEVRDEAAGLNQPPLLLAGFAAGDVAFPVRVTGEGVSLEVLKRAEREEALVLRVVETRGRAATAVVECRDPAARIVETDLMEWADLGEVGVGRARVALSPFAIRTFVLR